MTKLELERQRRVREELPTTQPILGARCPRAQARLYDWSVNRRDQNGVGSASEVVLAWVQKELRERESPLDVAAAFELAGARRWALAALIELHGKKRAKEIELELADGAPLAICMGPRTFVHGGERVDYLPVQTIHGLTHVPLYGQGCRAVFHDTTRITGRMWRYWCPECKPSKRQARRALAQSHSRAVSRIQSARIPRDDARGVTDC